MPTFVLASSVAILAAADIPLPVEVSALALVGAVLRWFIVRDNQADRDREARLVLLEEARDEQRHLKHLVINQLASITGTLRLIQIAAERCTCGAVAPVLPLIQNLLTEEETPT